MKIIPHPSRSCSRSRTKASNLGYTSAFSSWPIASFHKHAPFRLSATGRGRDRHPCCAAESWRGTGFRRIQRAQSHPALQALAPGRGHPLQPARPNMNQQQNQPPARPTAMAAVEARCPENTILNLRRPA